MPRRWAFAFALTMLSGCVHYTKSMELKGSWRARPGTRFYLVGSQQPELALPPEILGLVLASIRGGLGEIGHSGKTGYSSLSAAQEAMRAAGCTDGCVAAEVTIVEFSAGRDPLLRLISSGPGDMNIRMAVRITDLQGTPLTEGELHAFPYDRSGEAAFDKHVVPTIGPAFADVIGGAP